jgi:hypothetical protein
MPQRGLRKGHGDKLRAKESQKYSLFEDVNVKERGQHGLQLVRM